MTGLFHMFLFIVGLFSALLVYAYVDHKRFRSKARRYIESRLGLYGIDFNLTRFVRMARVNRPDSGEFLAVFPAHHRHLVIRDFSPETLFDVPPDGVILSDRERNLSWLFLEQKKQVFFSKLRGFLPESACYIRRGAGTVVFDAEEIPGNIRDWFLIDKKNGKTGWLLQDSDPPRQYRGFSLVEGFAPGEGELQDEGGRVILLDRERGTFALRDGSSHPFRVHRLADIISCITSSEAGSDELEVLELKVKGERDPWRFDFGDVDEAAEWRDRLLEASDGEVPPVRKESGKLEPVPQGGKVL
ncbi:MAG: hypothetical protein ACP5CD_03205 [Thermovirgaceae bacterium]